jgi:hypothetical protein
MCRIPGGRVHMNLRALGQVATLPILKAVSGALTAPETAPGGPGHRRLRRRQLQRVGDAGSAARKARVVRSPSPPPLPEPRCQSPGATPTTGRAQT